MTWIIAAKIVFMGIQVIAKEFVEGVVLGVVPGVVPGVVLGAV